MSAIRGNLEVTPVVDPKNVRKESVRAFFHAFDAEGIYQVNRGGALPIGTVRFVTRLSLSVAGRGHEAAVERLYLSSTLALFSSTTVCKASFCHPINYYLYKDYSLR